MNVFEWIGFFISMFSVFFLVGKALYDTVQNQKNPSKFKAQQEEAERRFKAFLRGESVSTKVGRVLQEVIDEDEEEERVRQAPPKKAAAPQYKSQQRLEEPAVTPKAVPPAAVTQANNSAVKNLLLSENTPKNMVILYEVFGPPKGLR